ncbi:hypothetical protein [Candidatus Burkholderia verschuerenii]|uniref:hypothetical protein n=1 Tax=Candidatus Burkholderia verschuerenii TaxID=242163 RepID=UPI00067D0157|nr:hypothetical protein [Candidatus Burkholderia verschuerenii]
MTIMRFATVFVFIGATFAAPAFAHDDGPRSAQDRLDTLVAQHAQANRHIAQTGQLETAQASKTQAPDDAS